MKKIKLLSYTIATLGLINAVPTLASSSNETAEESSSQQSFAIMSRSSDDSIIAHNGMSPRLNIRVAEKGLGLEVVKKKKRLNSHEQGKVKNDKHKKVRKHVKSAPKEVRLGIENVTPPAMDQTTTQIATKPIFKENDINQKTITNAAQEVANLVEAYKQVGSSQFQKWLLAEQTAQVATEIAGPVITLMEHIVELFPAKKQTKCYKCEQGCFKVAKASKKTASTLNAKLTILGEILPQVNTIIQEAKANGDSSPEALLTLYLHSKLPDEIKTFGNIQSIIDLIQEVPANAG